MPIPTEAPESCVPLQTVDTEVRCLPRKILVLAYACFGRGLSGGCSSKAAMALQAAMPHRRRLTGSLSADERPPEWMLASVRSKAAYSRDHNYTFVLAGSESYRQTWPRPRSWGVLRALQAAVQGGFAPCDWVWYADLDTVITEPQRDILEAAGLHEPCGEAAGETQ